MPQIATPILLLILGLFLGIIIMFIFNQVFVNKKIVNMLENAKKEGEKTKRNYLLEAKEEAYKIKQETDKEVKERKNEAKEAEERLLQRENNLDKRDQSVQKRETMLLEKENNIIDKQKLMYEEECKIEELKKQQIEKLEQISKYTKDKAKEELLKNVEEMIGFEMSTLIKEKEKEAELEIDRKAKSMLVSSMQRYAADVSNEQTVTAITLPNDEMKGRIIGREGRNIRTIEAVTGVDLIIDDTPETIVVSSFDPYRREIARLTIETLIKDGRIHPTRVEELYDKICNEMKVKVRELGENALFELGITKVDPELVTLLGKLHFRTSFGQNVLQHSIEVASLAGIMASELGENVMLAKRAGLLHDIGKVVDHELEGSHVDLGSDLAKKYHEHKVVLDAIESHHGDKEANSVIAVLVAVADALSASRPGARNDSLENYVKRLKELENIGNSIDGVDKTYAVQAGRELRVIVKPDKIDDVASYKVARDIKNKIEAEMQYPGTIKVTVIRETRAIEEAR